MASGAPGVTIDIIPPEINGVTDARTTTEWFFSPGSVTLAAMDNTFDEKDPKGGPVGHPLRGLSYSRVS